MTRKGEFVEFAVKLADDEEHFKGLPTHMQILVELAKEVKKLKARIKVLEAAKR